jgi:L-asparaginase
MGGTIAAAAARGGAGYVAGVLPISELLPDAQGGVRVDGEQVCNTGSQAVTYADWVRLANRVQQLIDSAAVDGIVVTHGTDTLEETAYFLDLVIHGQVPVVLTGAMRPAYAPGADGMANLMAALAVAAAPCAAGREVLAVMNEQIHAAWDMQKMATTGVHAFASPNCGPAGWVRGRDVGFFHAPSPCPPRVAGLNPLPAQAARVFVLYAHGDLDPGVARALVDLVPDGIVLAGVGDGNTSEEVLAVLTEAAASGMTIVRASRTGSGRVIRNVEVDDDDRGFLVANYLSPQKARILLMLALTQTRDRGLLQRCFMLD